MFKVGDKIEIISIPEKYGIPMGAVGQLGVIIGIDTHEVGITLDVGMTWWFPRKGISLYLKKKNINKWNPLNYKSHFEPLKLP